jgi:hypothetical protein
MEKDEGFLRYLEMSFGTRSLAGTIAWVTHQASRGWLGRRTKSAPH